MSLDWQSSPGYPYLRGGTTNEVFFCQKDPAKFEERVQYVWQIVKDKLNGVCEADPIRLFIKPEPLKQKKIENKRYRLISSVSVVDSIIDIMLFGDFNKTLIDNYADVPNKAGWSQFSGGWRFYAQGAQIATDKSGWDWSANLWLFEVELNHRIQMCVNMNQKWKDLAAIRYKQLFVRPLFINSGGYTFYQKYPGVMKSGCQNTISTNSTMQVILHVAACIELDIPVTGIDTMGDDVIQEKTQRWEEYLDIIGRYCILKQVIPKREFAGMRFLGNRVEPLYRGKHSYMLLHMDDKYKHDLATSYTLLYHRSAYRGWMEKFFTSLGCEYLDAEYRDIIYDGDY